MIIDAEVRAALDLLKSRANDFELHRINLLEQDLTNPPVAVQIDDTHQKFNGIIYRRDKANHYQSTFHLHRAVYNYYFGEIPAGYVIHHIDHNPENNDITNLQPLTKSEHQKIHSSKKHFATIEQNTFLCPICGKSFIDTSHERIYCSSSCSAIAYQNQRRTELEGKTLICKHCGKEFPATDTHNGCFCSGKCSSAFVRKNYFIESTCPVCGKVFQNRQYDHPAKYCSSSCAAKARWQKRRQNQPISADK